MPIWGPDRTPIDTQDPDRAITLCDERGRLIARHDPRPEQGAPEIAS